MKQLLLLLALLTASVTHQMSAKPISEPQLSIQAAGLKKYKYYGRPEQCVMLSVHNKSAKPISFAVDDLKSNMVSSPNYTYEIKAKNQNDWSPFVLSVGSYTFPEIFRTINPQQIS